MSAIRQSGERAQLPELAGGFVQQVLSEWAADDRPRMTHLACLLLRQHGWTYSQIGFVFGNSKQWAERHCRKAKQQIRELYRGPTERDIAEGFSNPQDPETHAGPSTGSRKGGDPVDSTNRMADQ